MAFRRQLSENEFGDRHNWRSPIVCLHIVPFARAGISGVNICGCLWRLGLETGEMEFSRGIIVIDRTHQGKPTR